MDLIEEIKKTPIVVKSSPGYAINRHILPLFYNCIFLVENIKDLSITHIDEILIKKFKISPSFKFVVSINM